MHITQSSCSFSSTQMHPPPNAELKYSSVSQSKSLMAEVNVALVQDIKTLYSLFSL